MWCLLQETPDPLPACWVLLYRPEADGGQEVGSTLDRLSLQSLLSFYIPQLPVRKERLLRHPPNLFLKTQQVLRVPGPPADRLLLSGNTQA